MVPIHACSKSPMFKNQCMIPCRGGQATLRVCMHELSLRKLYGSLHFKLFQNELKTDFYAVCFTGSC